MGSVYFIFIGEKHSNRHEVYKNGYLSDILRTFYAEIRKKNGTLYSKSSFNMTTPGLQRKFRELRTEIDIIGDEQFILANQMFQAECVHLKKE